VWFERPTLFGDWSLFASSTGKPFSLRNTRKVAHESELRSAAESEPQPPPPIQIPARQPPLDLPGGWNAWTGQINIMANVSFADCDRDKILIKVHHHHLYVIDKLGAKPFSSSSVSVWRTSSSSTQPSASMNADRV
jgi:hypothetical protein